MNNRGLCWYCYWGWPKPIADIYDKYAAIIGSHALEYGRAHVVWADENFDDESIRLCIERLRDPEDDADDDALVVETLRALALVPREMREADEHVGYDNDSPEHHPKNFPPPPEWVMVRR
jgi:hypothetical protein